MAHQNWEDYAGTTWKSSIAREHLKDLGRRGLLGHSHEELGAGLVKPLEDFGRERTANFLEKPPKKTWEDYAGTTWKSSIAREHLMDLDKQGLLYPEQENRLPTGLQGLLPPDPATRPKARTEPDRNWEKNGKIQAILKRNPIYRAIIEAESSGDANTPNSPKGAIGLMQIMPSTALGGVDEDGRKTYAYGMNRNLSLEELKDPLKNIKFGTEYFEALKKDFGTDANALIAYNWGPGNYKKWRDGKEWEKINERGEVVKGKYSGEDFYELPTETQGYLYKILSMKELKDQLNHTPPKRP